MASTLTKIILGCLVVVAGGGAAAYALTKPKPHPAEYWANLGSPDVANGEKLFWAGGCVSCHAATGAKGEDLKVLSGGHALPSRVPLDGGPTGEVAMCHRRCVADARRALRNVSATVTRLRPAA